MTIMSKCENVPIIVVIQIHEAREKICLGGYFLTSHPEDLDSGRRMESALRARITFGVSFHLFVHLALFMLTIPSSIINHLCSTQKPFRFLHPFTLTYGSKLLLCTLTLFYSTSYLTILYKDSIRTSQKHVGIRVVSKW